MNSVILAHVSRITEKIRIILLVILLVFIVNMTIPQVAKAEPVFFPSTVKGELVLENAKPLDLLSEIFIEYENKVKQLKQQKPIKTITVVATAYSSDVAQTDSTPCITANGYNVCKHGKEDVIAANFLPFGAKVRIPELYGDKIFTVQDRMNARYHYRVDFWKHSRNRAITFGKRLVKVEVIEM